MSNHIRANEILEKVGYDRSQLSAEQIAELNTATRKKTTTTKDLCNSFIALKKASESAAQSTKSIMGIRIEGENRA